MDSPSPKSTVCIAANTRLTPKVGTAAPRQATRANRMGRSPCRLQVELRPSVAQAIRQDVLPYLESDASLIPWFANWAASRAFLDLMEEEDGLSSYESADPDSWGIPDVLDDLRATGVTAVRGVTVDSVKRLDKDEVIVRVRVEEATVSFEQDVGAEIAMAI